MITKIFPKRLRQARIEKGFSQRSLGLSLGISDKTISAYESNRSYPTIEVLEKISMILEKPVGYFVLENDQIILEDKIENILKNQNILEKNISDLINFLKKEE